MSVMEQAEKVLLDSAKARCVKQWDNVNDPPCHPSDEGWKGCSLCLDSTGISTALQSAIDLVIAD